MLASGLAAFAAFALLAAAAEPSGRAGSASTARPSQGREIKLVTDTRTKGLVKRGAFTAMTDCSGRFKPFAADIRFATPLDRSEPAGFRDKGNTSTPTATSAVTTST